MNRYLVATVAGVGLLFASSDGMQRPVRRAGEPPPFGTWRAALIEEAVDRGFEREFVETALGQLQPLARVQELDRAQATSPPELDRYLAERVTPDVIARGREMISRHRRILEQLEGAYGIQRQFLVAIWGAESGYGRFTGDVPVLRALATLAWQPRRAPYFRTELFGALQILRSGNIERGAMTGSWAGAMGQPQFMPTSYLEYAVDADGDGRRDIWRSTEDTLGSIANYLHRFGWVANAEWGVEVVMSPAVRMRVTREVPMRSSGCGAIRELTDRRPFGDWFARGLQREGGDPPESTASASLLTIGARAFLVRQNYETILAYNCSHRYALSVSLLADVLK